MKYVVIEIQTYTDGSVGNLVTAHDDRLQAESAYHGVLSAAAVSQLPCHAAAIMQSDGTLIDSYSYEHEVETEGGE